MSSPESITVLTTPERSDLFRAIVGDGADFRFDPKRTLPLGDFLMNLAIARGSVVVLDEEHFIAPDQMRSGIKEYLDDPGSRNRRLRLVIVCPERKKGDHLLEFLVAYCGIYDIIYDCQDVDVAVGLRRLLQTPNNRLDIVGLLGDIEWPQTSREQQEFPDSDYMQEGPNPPEGGVDASQKILFGAQDLVVRIEVTVESR